MKNRTISAIITCLFILIGCGGGSERSPMVGTWKLEVSAELLKVNSPDGKEVPELTMTFDADGTWKRYMNMFGGTSTSKGTWKLDGKLLSLTWNEKDGSKMKYPTTETFTLSEDMKSFELSVIAGIAKIVKQ